jgi:diaminopimelate decarboxylase
MVKMEAVHSKYTKETNFFGSTTPFELAGNYGLPLYVYNENILRERCKELVKLVDYKKFRANYSTKANSNVELLKIIKSEGMSADAMSPGEIFFLLKAGFKPSEILYISNNVNAEEFNYAIKAGVTVSVDSLSQLDLFGSLNPGGKVCIRFNPGVGAGHHEKVITGGKKTKFGVQADFLPQVKELLKKHNLKLIGLNQHIGSLFLEGKPYVQGAEFIFDIAKHFDDLEFIDLGGGYGIPYKKQDNQPHLDMKQLGAEISKSVNRFIKDYGKEIEILVEPGRYVVAESSVLLGGVYSVKKNYDNKYIGTDLGFNVLARPIMYDSHHDIEIYRNSNKKSTHSESVSIVGNICETGDIIAKDRKLPEIFEGDILGVMDAGAYGMVMASNYNNRLRPAEVLIMQDGKAKLIRRRDTIEDVIAPYINI